MASNAFARALMELIEQHEDDFHLLLDEAGLDASVQRMASFQDDGFLTADEGFVVDLSGGGTVQITVVANCREDR
jgi:uncharacterized protein (AIM24 family)